MRKLVWTCQGPVDSFLPSATLAGRRTCMCKPTPSHILDFFQLFCFSIPPTFTNMPSRKSTSSEAQPESRKSSLRRLSSIASFQTLFARRKGTNATDHTATSSSSNLSLSLSCTTNDTTGPSTAATSNLQHEDSIAELPSTSSALSSKRSSYVCLPDDPIGGMPRSRTFSNLPVPAKARKPSNLSQSKSHARLPSGLWSSTRLPSPPASTRKHSHSRLASVESKVPILRNRVKRSDTEPLLPMPMQQGGNLGRSTAIKENISLSSIRPLPATDVSSEGSMCDPTNIAETKAKRRSWRESVEEHTMPSASMYGSANPYASHPAVQIAREHRSSPAYKSVPQRKPIPGGSIPQPMQRWNSQPVLTNVTNNQRGSLHGEIRQTRLLSARQAPTPPVARPASLAWETARKGRPKSSSVSSSNLLQPVERAYSLSRTETTSSASSSKPSKLSISCTEPSAYWAGRLCALSDRYRNEELAIQLIHCGSHTSSGLTPKGQTDKMHTSEATTARIKRALDHLSELCITPEARESLLQFQAQYARQSGLPELAPPKPPTRTIVLGSVKSDDFTAGDRADKSPSEIRKASFMDRLLGRQKRRSLALG